MSRSLIMTDDMKLTMFERRLNPLKRHLAVMDTVFPRIIAVPRLIAPL